MPKYRVRYVGFWDIEVEAEDEFRAELQAYDRTSFNDWAAEEIEEEEEE